MTQVEIIDKLMSLRMGQQSDIVGMDLRIVSKATSDERVLIQDGDTQRLEFVKNLVRTDGVLENDHELTTWVEYRFPHSEAIVHRSVHVTVKKTPELAGVVEAFGR